MSKREQFANDARTTLSGNITDSATSLVVASASDFPTDGNFRILIGSELLLVTGVSGTTFTVERGAESTTAAAHTSGDLITQIVTAGGLIQQVNGTLLYADSRPLYHSITDESGDTMTVSDFTWVNQSGHTATDVEGTIYMTAPKTSGQNMGCLEYAPPSTPYTVTAGVRLGLTNNEPGTDGSPHFALGWRDSSTGGLSFPAVSFKYSITMPRWLRYTDPTTYSSDQLSQFSMTLPEDVWMRIVDNGTNHIFKMSTDGVNWLTIATYSRTAYLTTPDRIFIGLDSTGVSAAECPGQFATIFHFSIATSAL